MKRILLPILLLLAVYSVNAQSQIATTGNNLISSANPYAADILIGSDAFAEKDTIYVTHSGTTFKAGQKKYCRFRLGC